MAVVKPFRALRYDEAIAGSLSTLVAPPYDVIGPDERRAYLERSPYNIVHLTLPDTPEEAGRDLAQWRAVGVLRREDEPAVWALAQTYVGPDGLRRSRVGLVASLRAEPYERRVVLPHERTHAGPKEGRLRLLRATRTQLEPIFLLHDGEPEQPPEREPDLEVEGDRLWRLDPDAIQARFADLQLLIADGHHRYETALAFHEEDGAEASAYLMAVLVSTRQEGLTIFPTHRIAQRVRDLEGAGQGVDPLRLLGELDGDRGARAVVYRRDGARILRGDGDELDAELVERHVEGSLEYTPRAEEAIAAVDEGRAEAAFLLRPPRIETVFDVARAGRTMPQKSTYFYPKLTSGLLLHPLD